ncbi:MAG: ParB/RepB/Spo0J family partition protein [Stomatobaculum sp.]
MAEKEKKTTQLSEKAATGSRIVMIRTELLWHHPENPRKNIGDITELAESMKKNGVMQNLTVIPVVSKEMDYNPNVPVEPFEEDPNNDSHRYFVLIGNRRMEAAKAAGVELIPCRIVTQMPFKKQLGIMLEENMQRADLTIYEQAQGFQMMLDLGETEDTIAAKTGFGKTTIRHRLNIAKLNQKVLQEKEKTDGFQLSISDLIELEKVKSIKTRDKILKEATSPQDLKRRALQEAQQEKRMEHAKVIKGLLDKRGIKEEPKAHNNLWNGAWEIVKEIDLDEEPPKKLRIGEEGDLFWTNNYRGVAIIKKKTANSKKEPTEWEKKQKETESRKKSIKAMVKAMGKDVTDYIKSIIDGKVESIKEEEAIPELWKTLTVADLWVDRGVMLGYIIGKEKYNMTETEKKEAAQILEGTPVSHQMLMYLPNSFNNTDSIVDYNGGYKKDAGAKLQAIHDALALYGFDWSDPEHGQIADGSHKLYQKP